MTGRPLSHIRVLDFGHYLAGPLVGMMFADLGAEVIRIDPPGGPKWRDPAFDMLSRGKKALTLDLKTDLGRQTALDLVVRSDLGIENFRPRAMARLGLGPKDMHAVNPGLISLSLPGIPSTDPALADVPAWEAVIAARTGQFTDMGLNRRLMGINPSFTPLGLASAYGSAFGAIGSGGGVPCGAGLCRCGNTWRQIFAPIALLPDHRSIWRTQIILRQTPNDRPARV